MMSRKSQTAQKKDTNYTAAPAFNFRGFVAKAAAVHIVVLSHVDNLRSNNFLFYFTLFIFISFILEHKTVANKSPTDTRLVAVSDWTLTGRRLFQTSCKPRPAVAERLPTERRLLKTL